MAPKLLLGAVCCVLSDCGLQGKEWPCDPPYLHQLLLPPLLPVAAIHLHLPSPIQPLSLYATQPLSNSEPACFWKPMSVSLPNLEESPALFFAAQPWSLGAWGAAVGDTGLTLPTLTASN